MGRFFTSTQIYNPKQLDRDGFKADFCKKMKNNWSLLALFQTFYHIFAYED